MAGYGAPGKGNTLLNYCGIRTDFLDYTVDRNPYKHGRFTPGTHIPIYPPERIVGDEAGLRADPAVERQGRDHVADGSHPAVGRQVRGPDSDGDGLLSRRVSAGTKSFYWPTFGPGTPS